MAEESFEGEESIWEGLTMAAVFIIWDGLWLNSSLFINPGWSQGTLLKRANWQSGAYNHLS